MSKARCHDKVVHCTVAHESDEQVYLQIYGARYILFLCVPAGYSNMSSATVRSSRQGKV